MFRTLPYLPPPTGHIWAQHNVLRGSPQAWPQKTHRWKGRATLKSMAILCGLSQTLKQHAGLRMEPKRPNKWKVSDLLSVSGVCGETSKYRYSYFTWCQFMSGETFHLVNLRDLKPHLHKTANLQKTAQQSTPFHLHLGSGIEKHQDTEWKFWLGQILRVLPFLSATTAEKIRADSLGNKPWS